MRAEREFKQQIVNSINPNKEKYITCIRGPKGVDWCGGAAGGRREQLKSRRRKRRQRRALLSSHGIPLNREGWKYMLLIKISCCPRRPECNTHLLQSHDELRAGLQDTEVFSN